MIAYLRRFTIICALLLTASVQRAGAQLNTYSFSQSTGSYQQLSGATALVWPANTQALQVALPFSFAVDTVAADSVWITRYGFAGLKTSGVFGNGGYGNPLSTFTWFKGVLSPFASIDFSLVANQSSIRYLTTGTAPSRIFKIEWYRLATSNYYVSFQAWLYEGSDRIDFVYDAPFVSGNINNAAAISGQVGLRSGVDSSVSAGSVVNRTTRRPVAYNSYQILLWNASDSGLNSSVRSTIDPQPNSTMQVPPAGLTYTWMRGLACTASAAAGTLPQDSVSLCDGRSHLLVTSGTPAGMAYQWQYSTDNGLSWSSLATQPGNGQHLNATSLPATATTLYRRRNTCLQNAAVSYSDTVKVLPLPAQAVPFFDGFESAANPFTRLPGCFASSGEVTSVTALQLAGTARTGNGYVSFNNTPNWLLTPGVWLESGKQYRMEVYFRSASSTAANDSIRLGIGTAPDSALIRNVAGITHYHTSSTQFYRRASLVFSVPANGRYFGGISVRGSFIDDLEIIELPQQDVIVDSMIGPLQSSCFPTAAPVSIRLSNAGQQPLSNVPVYFRLNNVTYGPEVVPGPIAAGGSTVFTFSQTADLSGNYVNYTFRAWSALPGDGSAANDTTLAVSFRSDTLKTVPYTQNFDQIQFSSLNSIKYYPGQYSNTNVSITSGGMNSLTQYMRMTLSNSTATYRDSIATVPVTGFHNNTFLLFDFRIGNAAGTSAQNLHTGDTIYVLARAGCGSATDTLYRIHNGNKNSGPTMILSPAMRLNAYLGTYARFSFVLKRSGASYTNTCFDVDNIRIIDLPMEDVSLTWLAPVSTVVCSGESYPVKVVLKNNGGLPASGFPVQADMGGLAGALSYTYAGTLQHQKTDTVIIGSLTPTAPGLQTLKVYTAMSNDTSHGGDTLTRQYYLALPPAAPAAASHTICLGNPVQLAGSSNDTTLTLYYLSNTATTPVAISDPFIATPAVTTYYYGSARAAYRARAGKAAYAGSTTGWTSSTWGHTFNALSDMVIDSVAMYPSGTGSLSFSIRSCAACASPVTFGTVSASFSGANGSRVMVPVGVFVPKGESYVLRLESSSVSLGREFPFSGYPITRTASPMEIVAGTGNGQLQYDGYYYFYDLAVRAVGCESARTITTVNVNPQPNTVFNVTQNGAAAAFSNQSTGGGTFAWDFGDGATDNQPSTSHTYAANGIYSVKLVQTNSCGSDSTTRLVVVTGLSVSALPAGWSALTLHPNPTRDHLEVAFNAAAAGHLTLRVYDLLGRPLRTKNVQVAPGANAVRLELDGLASGTYQLRLQDGTRPVNLPFVIAR